VIELSLTLAMKSTSVGSLSALLPRFQQVVLYRDDLAAGGGGEEDHVVGTGRGLDVRAEGTSSGRLESL